MSVKYRNDKIYWMLLLYFHHYRFPRKFFPLYSTFTSAVFYLACARHPRQRRSSHSLFIASPACVRRPPASATDYRILAGYPASLETLSPGLSPPPSLVPLSPLSYSSLPSTLPPSDYPASLRITAFPRYFLNLEA